MPTPVAGATHDRTVPGVARFNTQLHPRPVATDSAPITAAAINPAVTTGRIRARTGSPVPSQSQPMYKTPSAAGTFTAAANAHSTMPATGLPRRATARPAMSRPSMMASLCAPPTRWRIVTGLSTATVKA